MRDGILKWLSLFFEPDEVFEVRGLGGGDWDGSTQHTLFAQVRRRPAR